MFAYQAKAFELSYLEKVPEVKDTVHKQSLLHHVCTMVVENFPDSSDLYSEIGAVTRSAKVRAWPRSRVCRPLSWVCACPQEHRLCEVRHPRAACIPCSGACGYGSSRASRSALLRSFSHLWFSAGFFPTEVCEQACHPGPNCCVHGGAVLLTRLGSQALKLPACLMWTKMSKRGKFAPPQTSIGPGSEVLSQETGLSGPLPRRLAVPVMVPKGNGFIGL